MRAMRWTIAIYTLLAGALLLAGVVCGQSPSRFFPQTDDEELKAFFADASVGWYDVETKPPKFQHDFGFLSIYRDIGPGGPRYSNGNGEWPWAHPSVPRDDGLTRNLIGIKKTGVSVFRTQLPQQGIVRVGGSRSYNYLINQGSTQGIDWKFGEGTDVVEIVTNRILGADYAFKVHRMTLVNDEWVFRVYRPFTSQNEYEAATNTKAVRVGNMRMKSSHLRPAFDQVREVWKVPRIEPETARQLLLDSPFKLATDDTFIPTTDHQGQVYPQGYLGAYIGNATNQEDCRRCHIQVAVGVRKFDNGEWYGHIRGGGKDKHGAGVFSWYPE